MRYISTRGENSGFSGAEAIEAGLAPDGGLFVPEAVPRLELAAIAELAGLDYQERAGWILGLFLDDYSSAELAAAVSAAYNDATFDDEAVAPVRRLANGVNVLELWHGPTSAFKDMALQLLPQLLSRALAKTGGAGEVAVLVATSGDTGKAALEGFKDVDRIRVVVFFPEQGVSEIQRLQMVTQEGGNVSVVAVRGNFDDAQAGVKAIFGDKAFAAGLAGRGLKLSSANSINWGRLLPQIVYYFSAYADLLKAGGIRCGEAVNFAVPTGNFGNILAGYYAKLMGLPVGRLVCAANANNVLADFFRTGVYDRRRAFHKTLSPSMDILVSSNLERLLYHVTGGDAAVVRDWMDRLSAEGVYDIGGAPLRLIQETFWSGWADDRDTAATISQIYNETKYLLDPHTAVAWRVYEDYRRVSGDGAPVVIVSTASPFKFNRGVLAAIAGPQALQGKGEFEILRDLSRTAGWPVPPGLARLDGKPVVHKTVCGKHEMYDIVNCILNNEYKVGEKP